MYIQKDGQQQGPFSEDQIRQSIDAGEVAPSDLAWATGKVSWQPLSALIDLDTTKPPPFLGSSLHESGSSSPVVRSERALISPPPFRPATARQHHPAQVESSLRAGSAPSPNHSARPTTSPVDPSKDKSHADDLKTIRLTGILYVVVILVNLAVGIWVDQVFLVTAAVLAVCTLGIWLGHSRIAAVVLLLFLLTGIVLGLLSGEGMGFWPLTMLQVGLTMKATEAVFRLNKRTRHQPS